MKKPGAILLLSVLLIAQLAFAATASAEAIVLDFEDLYAPKQGYGDIPDGYQGFTWQTSQWIAGRLYPKSGADSGVIGKAGLNPAYGTLSMIAPEGRTFDLNGAYIKAVWNVDQTVEVQGWQGDTPLELVRFQSSCTGKKPQYQVLSLKGITKVTFSTDGGAPAAECDPKGAGAGFARIAIDNIEIVRP